LAASFDGAVSVLRARRSGSTRPIAEVRRHAGIVKTERFVFDLP
jgi:hypothetical protein